MKFCPKCQTKYEEEIIRFCTKDGSPLVEDNPSFSAMPSEASIDDIGEETIISRPRPVIPPPAPDPFAGQDASQRVVIPIAPETKQAVRPLETPQTYRQPERKSNTAVVVFLTTLGTCAVLGGAFVVWWFLQSSGNGTAANANSNSQNVNSNLNVNYNSVLPNVNFNTGINSNSNFNTNVNTNANVNANLGTPTPTKTPTPKPSPDANSNVSNTIVNISPSNTNSAPGPANVKTPTPTLTPTPTPTTPKPTPSTPPANVNLGVLNSRARDLRKPSYPSMAKQMGASGQVVVQVSIDENGQVTGAKAVSGHPLLRSSAETAARQSAFNPVKLGDRSVRASGTVVYNFINQ